MIWSRVLKIALVVALLGGCAAGYHFYRQDQEFRQLYGRITPVSLFNWAGEVEKYKEDVPVLLFFHASNEDAEQRALVEKFAWNQAGKVKVVSIDLDRPENLLFAARFGMLRHPGFAVVYKNGAVRGYDGRISSLEDLHRLVHEASTKQP